MPVDDYPIHKVSPDRSAGGKQHKQIAQGHNASEDMRSMNPGEEVEERTVGICGQVKPLSRELSPRQILAAHKDEAEYQCDDKKQQPFAAFHYL